MSNIIKIKSGLSRPADGVLQDSELGYARKERQLYIGQGTKVEPVGRSLSEVLDYIFPVGAIYCLDPASEKPPWLRANSWSQFGTFSTTEGKKVAIYQRIVNVNNSLLGEGILGEMTIGESE